MVLTFKEYQSNNIDFNELMKMISNMDKKELESKMNQVSNMLKSHTNMQTPFVQ